MQGAIHGIALDWNQPALDIRRQPRLHRGGEPAEQGDAGSAAFAQPAHQFVDLLGGVPDDPPRDRISGVRMPHHQGAKVA
jgi:hypothetical protein